MGHKFLASDFRCQSECFVSPPRLITDSFSPAAVLPIRRVSLHSDGPEGAREGGEFGRRLGERELEGGRGRESWAESEGFGGVRASGQKDVSGLRDGAEAAKGVAVDEESKNVIERVTKGRNEGYKTSVLVGNMIRL